MNVYLKVPYSEKDEAKSLGAKWDMDSRQWYVPEGMLITPFECWLGDLWSGVAEIIKPKTRKPDTVKVGKKLEKIGPTTTGAKYFETGHNCIPWEPCAVCAPIIESRKWNI